MSDHAARPYLTVCIDAKTRKIVASRVDLDAPDIRSAMLLLQQVSWECPSEILIDGDCLSNSVSFQRAPTDLHDVGSSEPDPED